MNKLLLFSGLISVTGFGQISLTNTTFPVANDNIVMSTLLDLTIDYSSTGANYTWDYSSMTPTGQRFIDYQPMSEASQLSSFLFGSFAPAPYKASYFNATTDLPLAELTSSFPVTIDGISGFSKSAATGITMIGWEFILNGTGIPVKSDTIETRYAFPLNYGDSYESRGYSKLNMNPIYDAQWIQHRHRESDVDGWGMITTPYGSFNALRIHHRIEETDSLYISINGTGTWIGIPIPESHEYEWRAAEEKEAILRIKTTVLAGNETVNAIEYRADFDPTLAVAEKEVSLDVFPNPVTAKLSINASTAVLSADVFNQQGQRVTGFADGNSFDASLDLIQVKSGMYYVVIATAAGNFTRLIVKD